MPPIKEYSYSYSSDDEPSKILGDRKRGKKSLPSINTRASRVGVTNFINVIKNLHPGESIAYFPITKETLQQYIDSKRKAHIKAGSLEQYLQHIQAYNLALGFGWDGQAFGPIIKKALDELRLIEEETTVLAQSSEADTSPDPLNENVNGATIVEDDPIDEIIPLDVNLNSKQSEPLPPLDIPPTLKSVTIRSKSRVYKQKIAVSDTTTFASLISFAIKIPLPSGKQFVVRDSDSGLEYMPDGYAREVIKGVEHADVTVSIEDVNSIDFNYF